MIDPTTPPTIWELRETPPPQRFVLMAAMLGDGTETVVSFTPDQARDFAKLLCEYAANIDARERRN